MKKIIFIIMFSLLLGSCSLSNDDKDKSSENTDSKIEEIKDSTNNNKIDSNLNKKPDISVLQNGEINIKKDIMEVQNNKKAVYGNQTNPEELEKEVNILLDEFIDSLDNYEGK